MFILYDLSHLGIFFKLYSVELLAIFTVSADKLVTIYFFIPSYFNHFFYVETFSNSGPEVFGA